MPRNRYYLTTPLYYVNAKPHIGHSYTNIAADTLARFKRLNLGRENVLFLTGTDEHGQKIDKAAQAAGMNPKEFTDKISLTFRDLWKALNISQDDFIRTTELRHKEAVKKVWIELDRRGEIYTAVYSGYYCTPCETFLTDEILRNLAAEGKQILCPECQRPAEKIEESNYFFKLSKYQDWLIERIQKQDQMAILPDTRRNEVLGFLKNNKLQDLCVSRPKSRLVWGIECPLSPDHVTYVWFDALVSYISACGYGNEAAKEKFTQWWPADVHIIGKDILRHHAIYWTILLHALELPLPKMIFAHGWWVQGGEKMSKSLGNVVDPIEIVKTYGVDAFRYFLLRESPFGQDGTFSEEALISRFNTDLANDLGNLLHRSLTMCEKYFEGQIPAGISMACPGRLRSEIDRLPDLLAASMEKLDFSLALTAIWQPISIANKYIEDSAPWTLAKQGKQEELKIVIVALLETLKVVSQAVWPFMPSTAEAIWKQLGIETPMIQEPFKNGMWGFFQKGGRVAKGAPLFPRIETKKP